MIRMTRCVFTGQEAQELDQHEAFEKGYLNRGWSDLKQITENPYVFDGNDAYWTIKVRGKLYSIKRKSTKKIEECLV